MSCLSVFCETAIHYSMIKSDHGVILLGPLYNPRRSLVLLSVLPHLVMQLILFICARFCGHSAPVSLTLEVSYPATSGGPILINAHARLLVSLFLVIWLLLLVPFLTLLLVIIGGDVLRILPEIQGSETLGIEGGQ